MFGNLLKKELKELLNIYSIVFIAILALVYGMLGQSIENAGETAKKMPSIALLNYDRGLFSQYMNEFFNNSTKIVYSGTDEAQAMKTLESLSGVALVVVPQNFSSAILSGEKGELKITWLIEGTGVMDSIEHNTLNLILESLKTSLTRYLLNGKFEVEPEILLDPFKRKEETIIRGLRVQGSPSLLVGAIQSRSTIIPIVVLMLVMMSGMNLISSIGIEKENRTLEILLTLPISRNYIVLSKIVASAITGLVLASIYMVGMFYYLRPFSSQIPQELQDVFTLTGVDYALFGLSLFFALVAGLSLFVVIASFAKDYRGSQAFGFPLSMLGVVPMLITIFKDFHTLPFALKLFVFVIPFSHPMIAIKELMLNNPGFVMSGILYSIFFSLVFMILATRIYNSERILVGKVKSEEKTSWTIFRMLMKSTKPKR